MTEIINGERGADIGSDFADIVKVNFAEQSSDPVAPGAGHRIIYTKANGVYARDSSGVVVGPLVNSFATDGRLTLESGVPVSTTDQTAKTTLYYARYKGNQIALFDGVSWGIYTFSELSIAIPASTATNYAVYVYDNSGTLTLELEAWTNETTRATALVRQDGVLCKTGALTRRYVGDIRTTGVSGQCEDSVTNRLVWNYYNRVYRRVYVEEHTNHTYSTASYRGWNNTTAARVNLLIGVVEEPVHIDLVVDSFADAATRLPIVSVGVDVTNAATIVVYNVNPYTTGARTGISTSYLPTAGYHFYQVVEYAAVGQCDYNDCFLNIGVMG